MSKIFQPAIMLALALMGIIVMMILPMPSYVLDIGLALSFALAILIFSVVLFIEEPLDFSAFPTILLASLMLRLSLNVSSTKLIIGRGHEGTDAAGDVIEGFAMFVMSGSVFLGLVVFTVLLIVNFMVITKGAARMAEVGARFALDGMPGRQMAIDSDMAAGAITHDEARERRKKEQSETTFFGSLDGASKFVKGDAIAGLLITLLNLVMGLAIGTLLHDMPIGRAFETYAILTVGDGLVTQIPAVIISIAAALLLARGGTSGPTDRTLVQQMSRHPQALATVAGLMVLFALVPGLPFFPFLAGGATLAGLAWIVWKNPPDLGETPESNTGDSGDQPPAAPSMGDILDLDEIHVEFAPDLIAMVLDQATGLDMRIANMRRYLAATYGLILPEIRLTDDAALPSSTYRIRIQGVEQARDKLMQDHFLAISPPDRSALPPGVDVQEPVYGAEARWITRTDAESAALANVTMASATEVLSTHLMEVIKQNFGRLFGLKSLRRILDEMTNVSDPDRAEANRRLIDEYIPEKVPTDLLMAVLRSLLDERVSIRNLPLILEAIAEARPMSSAHDHVAEHVRQRLGFQIIGDLRREDGTVPLVQMDDTWDATFSKYEIATETGVPSIGLPPEEFNRLLAETNQKLGALSEAGHFPAVVAPARRRKYLRTVFDARGVRNPVVSYEEVGSEGGIALLGSIGA
ncbi:MAG: flagellar biosynthesis protein FlhA [Rhodobacteraceae bacterium]|nr:flagellar biosynthesis protein FlhA [Paracoccaceae bacterium]